MADHEPETAVRRAPGVSRGARVAGRPANGGRMVLVLLFATIVADGYDTASLSFVIPALSTEWGLHPSGFTMPLVVTNIGAVIGYVCCPRLSARFGRSRVIWASVLVFSAGAVATVTATTVTTLGVIRFFTGLGLGTVLPSVVSLTADLVSPKRRDAATVLIVLGMAVGAVIGGVTGGSVITGLGWRAVFWIPAALAGVLAVLLWWRLPRDDESGRRRTTTAVTVSALVGAGLRTRTALLWAFAFLVFVVSQTLNTWLPTLLGEYGFAPDRAPLGTAAWGLGGIVGGAVLAGAATRFGTPHVLVVMCGLATTFLVLVAVASLAAGGLLLVLGLAGAGVAAGPAGQSALAIGMYDRAVRTAGIAWAVALGRIGSIVGPAVGGLLLSLGSSGRMILLLAAGPMLLAGVIVVLLAPVVRIGGIQDALPDTATLSRS
ncbi:MFS transporter [Solwaraspora sp. WMMB335]|uniref:MFS transporter n=1 Tax=Solwaraspora sp. WMMB335 TaxID=3404118 RepID=UPI003B926254